MTETQTLLADLERAECGSRELSDRVLEACGWHHRIDKRLPDRSQWGWLAPGKPPTLVISDPSPTESIDAALQLVPKGWSICTIWEAAKPSDRPWWGAMLRRDEPYKTLSATGAPTLALALCAANIRARQASGEAGDEDAGRVQR